MFEQWEAAMRLSVSAPNSRPRKTVNSSVLNTVPKVSIRSSTGTIVANWDHESNVAAPMPEDELSLSCHGTAAAEAIALQV